VADTSLLRWVIGFRSISVDQTGLLCLLLSFGRDTRRSWYLYFPKDQIYVCTAPEETCGSSSSSSDDRVPRTARRRAEKGEEESWKLVVAAVKRMTSGLFFPDFGSSRVSRLACVWCRRWGLVGRTC
jgi:hypothetical protein